MRRAVVVLGVVTAALAALPAAPAEATTTVKIDGNVVTLTVPIDLAGAKGKTCSDGTALAKCWERYAEDMWNAAFKQFFYKGCFQLKLDVQATAKSPGFRGNEGRDRVRVGPRRGSDLRGVGWKGHPEQRPSGDPGQRSPDGTRFFDGDPSGFFPEDATPTILAHEIGHTLGLGDDRDANGNALPGRVGTLMVGGANGVTPTTPLTIDRTLIDRIGKELAKVADLPECWAGKFHLESSTFDAGGLNCSDAWDIQMGFLMADSGKVSGTAVANRQSLHCRYPNLEAGAATQISSKVTGRREGAHEFALHVRGAGDCVPANCFVPAALGPFFALAPTITARIGEEIDVGLPCRWGSGSCTLTGTLRVERVRSV